MDLNGVAHAVLTQALGQFDNRYQEDCLRRYPGRFASVVGIDALDPAAPEQVAQAAAAGAVGVRLRPEVRSLGDDPLALWRAVADHGLVVSCAGAAAALLNPDFCGLLHAFPDTLFVLEHLGGWSRADCDRSDSVREGIFGLADHANVLLKVPALGQLSPRDMRGRLPAAGCVLDPAPASILFDVLARFGSDRMMWGSDYPPVSSREGYANALNWTRDLFAGHSADDISAIFGGTAARVFGFGQAN